MEIERGNVVVAGAHGGSDLDVAYLGVGPEDGPLALCLHGFPDSAQTWRHLLPALAGGGFRAVAPWLRGYAPTAVPADGRYQNAALATDAIGLHEALGGGADAVVIGHDWGSRAAVGAAVAAPERFARVVSMSVPVGQAVAESFLSYDQLQRSWYMFFFQSPLADLVVGADDLAFVERLWRDWSPGLGDDERAVELDHVRAAIGDPANLAAAIGYYRATLQPDLQVPELAGIEAAVGGVPSQPHLYLHGTDDGCIGVDVARRAAELIEPVGGRVELVAGAGHFLQLEHPDEVNRLVVDFLTRDGA